MSSAITTDLKNDWYVTDRISFSGTVTLPTGADPTDYTIKFAISRDGILLDTINGGALDANGAFSVSHSLAVGVTSGTVTVEPYLEFDTYSDYIGSFTKSIKSRPSAT